jgi:hypothetical protein
LLGDELGRTGALSFGAAARAFGACDITFGACAEGLRVFGFALRGLTGFALGAALTLGDAFCVVTGLITDFDLLHLLVLVENLQLLLVRVNLKVALEAIILSRDL